MLGRDHVPQTVHGSAESGKSQSVVRTFEPAPKIFLGIECLVKSGLVRFTGVSQFGVEECLSQITRRLEALVKAAETYQDRTL
jgi:hypothetical protein